MDAAQAGNESHSIRITSHGKIKAWVSFALRFIDEQPDVPLVLHTLPADNLNVKPDAGKKEKRDEERGSKLASSVSNVPRLVSVVEIIKREYLKKLAEARSPRLKGLHQYNEFDVLEDTMEGSVSKTAKNQEQMERERAERIVEALSGKNHVRHVQTPFMRVTLSLNEIPELVARGASYQPPLYRKISKSARARARKRAEKRVDEPMDED